MISTGWGGKLMLVNAGGAALAAGTFPLLGVFAQSGWASEQEPPPFLGPVAALLVTLASLCAAGITPRFLAVLQRAIMKSGRQAALAGASNGAAVACAIACAVATLIAPLTALANGEPRSQWGSLWLETTFYAFLAYLPVTLAWGAGLGIVNARHVYREQPGT